jgi:transposase
MATFQPVTLSESERADLLALIHRGKTSARLVTRAHILLKASEGWRDHQIITAFHVSRETVARVRARFADGGLERVLTDKRQAHRRRALSDEQATHLIAVACTAAPEGHAHWTLRLLAGKAVELGFVESISPETIRAVLKKTPSSPGSSRSGASRR